MTGAWWRSYDWLLVVAAMAISLLGVMVIHSADLHETSAHGEASHQLVSVGVGLALTAIFSVVEYQRWQRYAGRLYVVNLVLLVIVMHGGHSALGAQRWLTLGPLGTFQPSEPAKFILAITSAALLTRRRIETIRDVLVPLAALALPAVLILKQPDLGTALVLLTLFSGELFFAARRFSTLLWYGAGTITAAILTVGTNVILKPFQRDRLLIFLHPNTDLQGSGYNLHQAEIAIGSGGLFGKGLTFGTQTQLGFVPEHSRDFIFTVVGEELGFIGALALLAVFLLLIVRAVGAIGDARDRFGVYLAAGIVTMLAAHIVINIGMTIGVMPVTGIPLPFMSYGGSAVITDFAALGVLLNIRLQRDRFRF